MQCSSNKATSIPELGDGITTSSVMQSPGWTTCVKAQTSAVLGTSFNALTATITFDTVFKPFSCLPSFNSRVIIQKILTEVLTDFLRTKVSTLRMQSKFLSNFYEDRTKTSIYVHSPVNRKKISSLFGCYVLCPHHEMSITPACTANMVTASTKQMGHHVTMTPQTWPFQSQIYHTSHVNQNIQVATFEQIFPN